MEGKVLEVLESIEKYGVRYNGTIDVKAIIDLIKGQQAEIERLTKENNYQTKRALVAEGRVEKLSSENKALVEECNNCDKWQAVKDTAQKCLDDIVDCIEGMLDGERYMTKNEVEYLLEHILNKKQEYGVEVE